MEDTQRLRDWLGSGSINIFGLPFSGKDTQANRLAELFGGPVVSGGTILRDQPDSPEMEISHRGELAPTDFFLRVVLPYLSKPELKNKPLILDSLGRWKGEEEHVINAATKAGHPIKVALFIKADESEVRDRYAHSTTAHDRGARRDDASGAIDIRLEEFKNKTQPVIESYRQMGLLVEVDGMGTRDEVYQRIIQGLLAIAKQK